MQMIDFRSDTVTWPTEAMREAMATAAVGDDVYGEDPTINLLEAEAAETLGKEAGLLVVSGTMGNLVATLTHCGRGDEMIVGRESHIVRYEVGSHSALGGIHPWMLDVRPDGTMDVDEIRRAIRSKNEHFPTSRLVCLENTHGGAQGAPVSVAYTAEVGDIAHQNGMALHIDGARFFNAATALGVSAAELAAPADSVTFCLSKGLCAPVGSVLVGSRDFIERARRVRKSLGGGMRQAGVLAAAGLIALRDMTKRLGEDHANAQTLAAGLAAIPFVTVDQSRVRSNMVFFELTADAPMEPEALSERLKADYGILMRPYDPRLRNFRAVTHNYITRENVDTALSAIRTLLTEPVAAH